MTEKSVATGVMLPYGVAIGNALSKGGGTLDDLIALRDNARDIVAAQGDLVAALKALDAEIASRGTGAKAAPPAEEVRFVAQIEGLALPADVKAEIDRAIQKAVLAEVAKLDSRGDKVATPLSRAKDLSFLSPGRLWPPVLGLVLKF